MSILGNIMKRIFGKRSNILFMLIIPIVLNIVMISSATHEVKYNIGIIDEDSSDYTKQLITALKEKNNIKMLKKSDDVKSMILNKKLDCAFVFDKGFTKQLISGENPSVKSYAMEDSNAASPITMYLESSIDAAKQISKAIRGKEDAFYDAIQDYNNSEYKADYKSFGSNSLAQADNAVTSLGYIAFGMVFLLAFSTALILEDKLSGVYDRITASPLSKASYFVQYMCASFTVAVIQVLVLINILPKLVNVTYGNTDSQQIQVIIICCFFAAVCVSIGIFISRFSKNELMANALTSLINLPMIMLGGCLWPREIMPSYVQKIGDFVPTTWFLSAGRKVLDGQGLMAAGREMIYMLTLTVILLSITFLIKSDKAK